MSISNRRLQHQSPIPLASSLPCHFVIQPHISVWCHLIYSFCATDAQNVRGRKRRNWIYTKFSWRSIQKSIMIEESTANIFNWIYSIPYSPNNTTGTARFQCNQITYELSGANIPQFNRSIIGGRYNESRIELQTCNSRLMFIWTCARQDSQSNHQWFSY